jgi:VanZ family protein
MILTSGIASEPRTAKPMLEKPAPDPPQWNHYRWWARLGWLLIAIVMTLSLVRFSPPIPVESGDKYQHALAYAILMFWWGMLQPRRRWLWALALPALGVGLEFVQSFMPLRHMDWGDAMANALGVAIALVLLLTPLGRVLAWVDRQLGDRGHPGRS